MYYTKNIEELEKVYSVLREEYPSKQIEVVYNDNTKEYCIQLTNKKYEKDPTVPLDLKVEVVYGDSVTGDTPLLLKDPETGNINIETIQSIFDLNNKIEYPGFKIFDKSIRLEKEYSTTNYQIWTDIGWVNIKKVIRHKCDKQIYRVLTHTGCIDVTEDHSLLTSNKEPIKPGELKVGDSLLHSFPKEFIENEKTMVKMKKNITQTKVCNTCKIEKSIDEYYKQKFNKDGLNGRCRDCDYYKNSEHQLRNIMKNFSFENYSLTEKEAEVWGFFQGDGSCGAYHCKSGIKNSWALNNNNLERLNYFKDILESIEPIKFEILDTLKSSGVYKLVPKGSIKYMVNKYRNLFYYQKDCNSDGDKYKIVPNCILNASKEIKMAYWKGYYEADGAKTSGFSVDKPSFAVKGKIGAQCMYYLMRSIGFDIGINFSKHPKKQEIYFLNYTTFQYKKEYIVKKIIDKGMTNNYVYDIETEIGRFGGGVGQLQMVNTDSVFLAFKYNRDDFTQNRKDTFKLATICGDNLTNDIFKRPPIELEFEKVFQPFVLLTKKRYIGKKFEDQSDPFKLKTIDTKGIALTRRDYCKMVKKCYKEIIDVIMETGDLYESVDVFKKYVDKINDYKVETDDLVISAMLAKEYSCGLCKKKTVWSNIKCSTEKCNYSNSHLSNHCEKCKNEFHCRHQFSLAHVNLAVNLLKRKEEIGVNDRIQYLFVEASDIKQKKGELAEDPKYAQEHNLKYNRACYLEQLAKTILGFFKIVLEKEQDLLTDSIDYVNTRLITYNAKPLKPSDFILME